jgi:hypothetical protein
MSVETHTPRPDANDVLMGGGDGVKGAIFKTPGDSVEGVVAAPPKAREEREFNQVTQRSDGPVRTFPSGDPIYGILIDLQTQERDPMDPEDTGLRRLYVEGKRFKDAVRNAVSAAGGRGVEVGGYLKVTHTGMEAAGTVLAKGYAAEYRTPANQGLMGAPASVQTLPAVAPQPTVAAPVAAQPVAAAPVSVPAPAPVAAPAPGVADPVGMARGMFAVPGLPDAAIAAATGLDAVVVAALRAQG